MASPPDDFSGLPDRSRERRRTAIALLIAASFLGLFIFLAVRPALVLGNDAEALVSSLAGEIDGREGLRTSDLAPPTTSARTERTLGPISTV